MKNNDLTAREERRKQLREILRASIDGELWEVGEGSLCWYMIRKDGELAAGRKDGTIVDIRMVSSLMGSGVLVLASLRSATRTALPDGTKRYECQIIPGAQAQEECRLSTLSTVKACRLSARMEALMGAHRLRELGL